MPDASISGDTDGRHAGSRMVRRVVARRASVVARLHGAAALFGSVKKFIQIGTSWKEGSPATTR